jgi:hypothetical protein
VLLEQTPDSEVALTGALTAVIALAGDCRLLRKISRAPDRAWATVLELCRAEERREFGEPP